MNFVKHRCLRDTGKKLPALLAPQMVPWVLQPCRHLLSAHIQFAELLVMQLGHEGLTRLKPLGEAAEVIDLPGWQ